MKSEVKAELISIGSVDIDESALGDISIPTAGPGAGKKAFFFRSGNRRVRLSVNHDSPLKAVAIGEGITIYRNDREIARGHLEHELVHCPRQAYITVSEKCIFDCKFCPVPKLGGRVKTFEEVMSILEMAYSTGNLDSISITSGIYDSPEGEVERVARIVRESRKYEVPIGVSVYPTEESSRILKQAGASEIKYNVETMDCDLYSEVCPDQDLDYTLNKLEEAVELFGKNRVFSNFIIGLGESDDSVISGIRKLASLGVIPILRVAGLHPLRAGEVYVDRPDSKRILFLTRKLREILDYHGLRADISRTMCLPCTGCDMNPHIDLD
ncbi:Radical SAM domain protein [Methanosalsum zhilinae DSM 4017]|uniref:Radical SAM domain protein n=1 Tax=Methanosalsum zhilinae (strain DSM 4017 / NBRC 107636 / OCM 62 / WeN5) TaxID=679901 RepID=F7XPC2_METZD|nr:radical SAM protein [Methanosalsum zhilinae]AEH60249.1 Radical SAM domain protein [Methanosalsum zhilinae DSM 4017]